MQQPGQSCAKHLRQDTCFTDRQELLRQSCLNLHLIYTRSLLCLQARCNDSRKAVYVHVIITVWLEMSIHVHVSWYKLKLIIMLVTLLYASCHDKEDQHDKHTKAPSQSIISNAWGPVRKDGTEQQRCRPLEFCALACLGPRRRWWSGLFRTMYELEC